MVHYKLTYFDLRGRAESIRQVFAVAGVEFDDVRIAREDWPTLKPSTPFGQIPVLEVDGKQLAQSTSILRFLGRTFNLAGKTPLEDAKLDMIIDQFNDLYNDIRPYFMVLMGFAQGDKEKLKAEVFIPARDKHFSVLKKFLNGQSYILNDHLTWADIHIAEMISSIASKIPDAFDGFPELNAYKEKVQSIPKLRKYLAARPDAPF